MLYRNALELTQKQTCPCEHTPKRHTFYFNLAMLTYHSFLRCVKPLAAVSSYELWLHIPLNEAQMPQCNSDPVIVGTPPGQHKWSKIPT